MAIIATAAWDIHWAVGELGISPKLHLRRHNMPPNVVLRWKKPLGPIETLIDAGKIGLGIPMVERAHLVKRDPCSRPMN